MLPSSCAKWKLIQYRQRDAATEAAVERPCYHSRSSRIQCGGWLDYSRLEAATIFRLCWRNSCNRNRREANRHDRCSTLFCHFRYAWESSDYLFHHNANCCRDLHGFYRQNRRFQNYAPNNSDWSRHGNRCINCISANSRIALWWNYFSRFFSIHSIFSRHWKFSLEIRRAFRFCMRAHRQDNSMHPSYMACKIATNRPSLKISWRFPG